MTHLNYHVKTQVLERDKNSCAICGTNEKRLHIHHIISWKYGGLDKLNNLIALCPTCHIGFHQKTIGAIVRQHLNEIGKSPEWLRLRWFELGLVRDVNKTMDD